MYTMINTVPPGGSRPNVSGYWVCVSVTSQTGILPLTCPMCVLRSFLWVQAVMVH